MKEYAALVLAAGKGTRMKSALCKVLHPVAGRPMVTYVVDALRTAGFDRISVVVGHQAREVEKLLDGPGIEFAVQEPQLGTGHAVAAAKALFEGFAGDVLILCGDIPLIEPVTLQEFIRFHEERGSGLTVMTTVLENPFGYGRIIRKGDFTIERIVEERDGNSDERSVREINTGIYLVSSPLLFSLTERVRPENAQREYYLTDIVTEARKDSIPVHAFVLEDSRQTLGINTRSDLATVSALVWSRTREELMNSGVTLLDPATVFIDATAKVGLDTVIHPGVTVSGETVIGKGCIIESGTYIMDSVLGDRVRILQGSRLDHAEVSDEAAVGPMAHLRPEARIGKKAKIGNFVEVKKTVVGEGTKAAHLSYLGDSQIGRDVNIGCGTITCNYDGKKKHRTIIGDRCFVGSDVQFVAPVEIGEGSVIGAGSTITRDIPPRTLAVARCKQKVYPLRAGQGRESSDEDRQS